MAEHWLAQPRGTTREVLLGPSGRGAVPRPAWLPQKPLSILKSGEGTLPKHDQGVLGWVALRGTVSTR